MMALKSKKASALSPKQRIVPSVNCPLCHGGACFDLQHTAPLTSDDPLVELSLGGIGQVIFFHVCCRCGLIFRSPRPSAEQLGYHYHVALPPLEAEIMGKMAVTIEQAERRETYRFKEAFRHVRQYCSAQKGHIVDVGGANGRSLLPWLDSGWEATLIDPGVALRPAVHPKVREVASIQDGLSVSDFKANVLTSYHCIEHFLDIQTSLTDMYRLSNPGTLWVIEVPFDLLYVRGLLDKAPLARPQIHAQHLNFFTPDSLRGVANLLGLRIISIKMVMVLYWFGPTVSLRLIARHEEKEQLSDQLPVGLQSPAALRRSLAVKLLFWRRWAGLRFRHYRYRTRLL